jgi:hypothetical protein
MMRVPATIPFSIDWLPDGQLLVVAGPGAAGANDRIWSFMIFSFVLLIYVSVHTMTRTASPSVPAPSTTGVSLDCPRTPRCDRC